jgi:transcriptional regulator EpsA
MSATATEDQAAVYSRLELDMLLLNIEAAARVGKRTEFFSWVQGVFQSAIAHEVLICGLAFPGTNGLRFEWQGSYPMAPELFTELCGPDQGLLYPAIRLWHERGGVPLLSSATAADARDSEDVGLRRLLRHWNLDNLVAHGLPGLDGRPAGFFMLCKLAREPAPREARMITMLLPYLYAGWLRANCQTSVEARPRDAGPLLTPRELEILNWMQKGNSNGEIAKIVGISQLTVKNHVQKILRKLGAQNRTHAVVKGISLSLARGGVGQLF